MKPFSTRWTLLTLVFAYTLFIRLLPYVLHQKGVSLHPNITTYPWNFSPIFAVCMFSGAYFGNRHLSLALPLATFLAGDLGIWIVSGRVDWGFYPAQPFVYGSLAVCVALGYGLQRDRPLLRIAGAGVAGCTLFFIVTNFAHWLLMDTYPKTLTGFSHCYLAAIPYYVNSLVGTAVFSGILFSPLCFHRHTLRVTASPGLLPGKSAHEE